MKILLVSATEMEIAPFRESYKEDHNTAFAGIGIRFLTSGIGMLATAARLTAAVTASRFDMVIQAGIAGSFQNNIPLGDVFRVSSDMVADLGVQENGEWKDLFDMGFLEDNTPPYHGKKLKAPELQFAGISALKAVSAVTVNEITTGKSRIEAIIKKYQPSLESMEGAALHFVCLENDLPFVQIRAVSNYIGERNKANWKIREAVQNLNQCLETIIRSIVHESSKK